MGRARFTTIEAARAPEGGRGLQSQPPVASGRNPRGRRHLLRLLPLLVLAACSAGEDTGPRELSACEPLVATEARPRSVVLVLGDTLRRDRLGAYGGPARTPAFDRFAEGALLFDAAVTQAPWTKPAIATLFSGLYPSQHGVVSHPDLRGKRGGSSVASDVLPDEVITLAEALSAAGYRTAAIVSNPWLRSDLGFAQGFEHFDAHLASNTAPGKRVTAAARRWLDELPDDGRPFFLYVHYMDPHAPYTPVEDTVLEAQRALLEADARPMTPRARAMIRRVARDGRGRPWAKRGVAPSLALMELVYDQGVERFDRGLGDLLASLDRREDAEELAILVTSDHGEALYERGWGGHGHGLHEEETGIPLAARLPGTGPPKRTGCPTGLIDVRASLCAYLGVECPGPDAGRSWFAPEASARVVVTEGVIAQPAHRSARDRRYKLVSEPGGGVGLEKPRQRLPKAEPLSLFDLAADPGESRDLLPAIGEDPQLGEIVARLRRELAEGIPAAPDWAREERALDPETRKRLEALGYLGADPVE